MGDFIVGDANLSEVATFLKVGTTCLVLAMIEDGFLSVDLVVELLDLAQQPAVVVAEDVDRLAQHARDDVAHAQRRRRQVLRVRRREEELRGHARRAVLALLDLLEDDLHPEARRFGEAAVAVAHVARYAQSVIAERRLQ